MIKIIVIILAMFAVAQSAQAGVYKCTVNGKTEYSGQPCSSSSKEYEIRISKPQDADAVASAKRTQQILERTNVENQRRKLDRHIYKAEKRLSRLETQRDEALNKLQADKRFANNNLAGATYENAIATEMQAVTMRYDPRIKAARDEVLKLKDKRQP